LIHELFRIVFKTSLDIGPLMEYNLLNGK
jgi:hypothetical protein